MCDDDTEAENLAYLERLRLHRRTFVIGAGGVAATLLTACPPPPAPGSEPTSPPPPTARSSATAPTSENAPAGRMVAIDTPDGSAEAFFVAPASGRHPGVIVWPDVAGLRDAYMKMATRLATSGYAVLAVNQYYRSSRMP